MKEKYIEEKFPRYFIFGAHSNGQVDVASTLRDTVATVDPEDAQALIKDRDMVIDILVKVCQAFDTVAPEAFSECWYGPRPKHSCAEHGEPSIGCKVCGVAPHPSASPYAGE